MAAPDLPAELEERIDEALEALEGRDDGHLPLPLRRAVRSHFGDMGERQVGRRRLLDLYRRCVERVLPVWQQARPDDGRPARMIELAEGVVTGRIDEVATKAEYDRFTVDLENLAGKMDERANAAGLAAADLVSTAAAGDYTDRPDDIPRDADDEDLDPYEWSSDYVASIAAASFFGADDEDPEARRRFWRWYLEQALPVAYRSVEAA